MILISNFVIKYCSQYLYRGYKYSDLKKILSQSTHACCVLARIIRTRYDTDLKIVGRNLLSTLCTTSSSFILFGLPKTHNYYYTEQWIGVGVAYRRSTFCQTLSVACTLWNLSRLATLCQNGRSREKVVHSYFQSSGLACPYRDKETSQWPFRRRSFPAPKYRRKKNRPTLLISPVTYSLKCLHTPLLFSAAAVDFIEPTETSQPSVVACKYS